MKPEDLLARLLRDADLYPASFVMLVRSVVDTYRRHRSVRAAAAELGMPKSTLHDVLTARWARWRVAHPAVPVSR